MAKEERNNKRLGGFSGRPNASTKAPFYSR